MDVVTSQDRPDLEKEAGEALRDLESDTVTYREENRWVQHR
jgi:hypothetical protein